MKQSERILIVGTGALACFFAARLSAAGYSIVLLGTWYAGLDALQRYGVSIVETDGKQRVYSVQATSDPQECSDICHALVLVKAWQTDRAAKQLASCLSEDGLALSLQNGLGNRETLSQVLGADRTALGITTLGATLLGPGRVRAAGEGVITLEEQPRLSGLSSQLQKAGFTVERTPDSAALLWGKLVVNAAINPVTALLGIPNGELLARAPARSLLAAAALETARVADAQGIQLPYSDPVLVVEDIAKRTANNRSSMLQDMQRNAPTEIDAICGAIVQAGELKGVPTPVNRTLWQLVKASQAVA